MAKARNRNLAGLAGLAAMGAMMARAGKKGADEAVPTPEDRGTMTGDSFTRAAPATVPAAAAPAAAAPAEVVDRGEDYGFEGRRQGPVASLPGRAASESAAKPNVAAARQTSAASRPAPVSYSAAEAATDLARESTRGVKPAAATPAATPAASSASRLGTPTRPAPGVPSIYAGREAWADYRRRQAEGTAGMKKGGKVKKMASGGSVSSASKRGDGIAQRGKTRGRMI